MHKKMSLPHRPGVLDGIPKDINALHYHISDESWWVTWGEIKRLDQEIYERIKQLATTMSTHDNNEEGE